MESTFVVLVFGSIYILVASYPSKKNLRWLKWLLVALGFILTVRLAVEVFSS